VENLLTNWGTGGFSREVLSSGVCYSSPSSYISFSPFLLPFNLSIHLSIFSLAYSVLFLYFILINFLFLCGSLSVCFVLLFSSFTISFYLYIYRFWSLFFLSFQGLCIPVYFYLFLFCLLYIICSSLLQWFEFPDRSIVVHKLCTNIFDLKFAGRSILWATVFSVSNLGWSFRFIKTKTQSSYLFCGF
jgi:hypothetical protein